MPELMEFSWPVFLRELDAAERVWNTRDVKYPRPDAVPWMPLPIAEFVSLLYEAMTIVPFRSPYTDLPNVIEPWIPGRNWLIDVGCGPGTKLRLAHAMFGLNCFGIDIVQRFVDETQIHGIRAANIDAFDFPAGPLSTGSDRARPFGYADFDIVYVNRPSGLQDELEHLIMERMGNGAVLIAVNWRNDPGRHGFTMHFQEQGEPVRGVWIKT
jgi:SAM-dependent methyltransferase